MAKHHPIKLLVGLGNPGRDYEDTRHNAGFWLTERHARAAGAAFRNERGFFGQVAKAGALTILLPQTFMNRSGQSVGALARFFKIAPQEILVAYDELDLPPGTAKFKKGGSASHNGIKDIVAALGSQDFWRLRIGIGHPRELGLKQDVADFVLHPPRRDERILIDDAIDRSLAALPDALSGDFEAAMMKLHGSGNGR